MFSCVFCCSGFLYIAFVSCYVFMLFVFDHDGPSLSSDSQLRFLPRILINSILVCTILWVEHHGHRRMQILFSSHPSFLCPGSGFSWIYPLSRIHGSCRGFCHVYVGIYVSKPFVCAKVYNTFESASILFKFEVVMYFLKISILLRFQGFCIDQWPSSPSSSPREFELKPVTTLTSIPAVWLNKFFFKTGSTEFKGLVASFNDWTRSSSRPGPVD